MPARTVRIDEVPEITVADGTIRWHALRHHLGVRAFGVNAYSAANAGDHVIEPHTEASPGAGGHEEIYVVLTGHARFVVEGAAIDAPAGTCVFLPDPEERREAIAEAAGTTVLAIGGERGKAYEPSPWEWNFRAQPHIAAGEWEQAAEVVSDGLTAHPGNAALLYNLACFEARVGQLDDAVAHLQAAYAAAPESVRGWGAEDQDLDPLRERADFPL
jgi:tetratricopeptide (TPR) repeat protein